MAFIRLAASWSATQQQGKDRPPGDPQGVGPQKDQEKQGIDRVTRSNQCGAIPVKVAALTAGVLKSMLLTKLKVATAVLLVAGATLVAGTGILSRQSLAAQEPTNLPQFAVAQGKQPAPQQKVEIIEVKGVVIRKDDVIRQAKHDIDVSLKKLAESKDEKAEQEALDAIEKRVKALGLRVCSAARTSSVPRLNSCCGCSSANRHRIGLREKHNQLPRRVER
jgi:hypothetical protein